MKTPREKVEGSQTGSDADCQRSTTIKEEGNHFFPCRHQAFFPYTFS